MTIRYGPCVGSQLEAGSDHLAGRPAREPRQVSDPEFLNAVHLIRRVNATKAQALTGGKSSPTETGVACYGLTIMPMVEAASSESGTRTS